MHHQRDVTEPAFSFFSSVRPLSDSVRELDMQCSETLGGHALPSACNVWFVLVKRWPREHASLQDRSICKTYMDAAQLAGHEGVRKADVAGAAAADGQRAAGQRYVRVLWILRDEQAPLRLRRCGIRLGA